MTAITTIWKKLAAAVFWLISGGLVVLITATQYATPRKRPASRHARPAEPKHDDGQTVDWLRALASPLRKRKVPPMAAARARVQALQSVAGALASKSPLSAGAEPASPAAADRLCKQELCKYWPGEGCMRGVMPCDDDGDAVPWADVDAYLTDDALRHGFNFEAEHPVLPGEHHPPWPGPFIDGHDIGPGFVVEPTLPPLPEPAADWKPHACGDVDQPTAILRADAGYPLGWSESDQALCLCGKVPDIPGDPITSEADCPAHGDPAADSSQFGGPPSDDDDDIEPPRAETDCSCSFGDSDCPCEADGPDGVCSCCRDDEHRGSCLLPPMNVPGPAESASPTPPGGAEAATPPAVVAGPGTPSCDDTAADLPAVAARAFIDDMLSHQASPEADWLDRLFDAAFVKAQAVREASR